MAIKRLSNLSRRDTLVGDDDASTTILDISCKDDTASRPSLVSLVTNEYTRKGTILLIGDCFDVTME